MILINTCRKAVLKLLETYFDPHSFKEYYIRVDRKIWLGKFACIRVDRQISSTVKWMISHLL